MLRGFCSWCGIDDFGQFGPWSIALPNKKLPVFPTEVTPIGPWMSVVLRGNQVVYLSPKGMTLRAHDDDDMESFWFLTSELYVCGNFKQADVVRAFGVSASSVGKSVKLYLAYGRSGFWGPPRRELGMRKTGSVREQMRQIRLDQARGLEELKLFRQAQAEAGAGALLPGWSSNSGR